MTVVPLQARRRDAAQRTCRSGRRSRCHTTRRDRATYAPRRQTRVRNGSGGSKGGARTVVSKSAPVPFLCRPALLRVLAVRRRCAHGASGAPACFGGVRGVNRRRGAAPAAQRHRLPGAAHGARASFRARLPARRRGAAQHRCAPAGARAPSTHLTPPSRPQAATWAATSGTGRCAALSCARAAARRCSRATRATTAAPDVRRPPPEAIAHAWLTRASLPQGRLSGARWAPARCR